MPLAQAVGILQAALPPHAVLVGQNIAKDVQWLGLKEGVHFEQVSVCGWRGQGWDDLRWRGGQNTIAAMRMQYQVLKLVRWLPPQLQPVLRCFLRPLNHPAPPGR